MGSSGLPLLHALGWTLLHFCWQGAAVALLLWCGLGVLPARWSRARYGVACAALALMTALPLATFARLASEELAARRAVTMPMILINVAVNAGGAGATPVPLQERVLEALDRSAPWLPVVWLAGVMVFLARLNAGLTQARRMRSAETEAAAPELLRLFEAVKTRLGVARAVRLAQSALVQAPAVIGWLRPVVLLPLGCFLGLSQMQVEALLAHELAHIRRHDYLVSVLQSVVETLLFYHPAVWWVSRQVRRERECCCDDLAVRVAGDRLAYARALSWLEERRASLPEMVLAANGGVLTMRIKRLLGYRESSVGSQVAALVVLAMLFSCGGAVATRAAWGTMRKTQPQRAEVAGGLANSVAEGAGSIAQATAPAAAMQVARKVSYKVSGGAAQAAADAAQAAAAGAAQKSGAIEGIVMDKTGAVVARAKLTATNIDTGAQMVRESDGSGKYTFSPLPVGNYNVEVEAKGFLRLLQENVQVDGKQAVGLNMKLSVAGGEMAVTVTPASPGGVWLMPGINERAAPPSSSDGSKATGPLRVSSGALAGNLISRVDPVYPAAAKAKRVQGAVVLHAVISKTGTIGDLTAVSGPMELVVAAAAAVQQWKYKPYLLNGEPTEVGTTITVNFSLAGPAEAPKPEGSNADVAPNRLGPGITPPLVIYKVDPEFSEEARKAHVSGAVQVGLWVDEQGNPTHVHVVRGVGVGRDGQLDPKYSKANTDALNEKAVEAVKQYRFKPAMEDGRPVAVQINVEVNFQIF